MTNKTFFKIAALIILVGIVLFLVTPKYETTLKGYRKINRLTGTMYILHEGDDNNAYWEKVENRRPTLDEIFKRSWIKRLFGIKEKRPPIESFFKKEKAVPSSTEAGN